MTRLLQLKPKNLIDSRLDKKAIVQFAEKMGMVYFGYVNQRDDEHRLIRGATVSTQHTDNHYCIGSSDGYDITLVRRSDVLAHPQKSSKHHSWLIMTFDIHTPVDLPHIFIGLHSRSDVFYSQLLTKFSHLYRVPLGTFGHYDRQFGEKYRLYSAPDQSLSAQRLINPDVATVILQHFGGLDVEIHDGVVYIYSEQKASPQVLDKMLQCGLWFARMVDERSR